MASSTKLPEGFLEDRDGKLWITPNRCTADIWEAALYLRQFESQFRAVYCLAHGGYQFGAIMGNAFENRRVGSLDAHSYTGEQQGEMFMDIPDDLLRSQGDEVMIIDDLIDSGKTAHAVHEKLPKAYIATVYSKLEKQPAFVNFTHLTIPNKWVVFPWEQPLKHYNK